MKWNEENHRFVLSAVCKICSLTFGLVLLKQPGD